MTASQQRVPIFYSRRATVTSTPLVQPTTNVAPQFCRNNPPVPLYPPRPLPWRQNGQVDPGSHIRAREPFPIIPLFHYSLRLPFRSFLFLHATRSSTIYSTIQFNRVRSFSQLQLTRYPQQPGHRLMAGRQTPRMGLRPPPRDHIPASGYVLPLENS